MLVRDPVCTVSRWDQSACGGAGDFRPILLFPAQPRRSKRGPIAPPAIDVEHFEWLRYLQDSGSTKTDIETHLSSLQ